MNPRPPGTNLARGGLALPADSPALARHRERVVFPLLADPATYVACSIDLMNDAAARQHWLKLFRDHFACVRGGYDHEAVERGIAPGVAASQAEAAQQHFFAYLDAAERDPGRYGTLDTFSICLAREDAMQQAGMVDAYAIPKREENQTAISLLPVLLRELDALDDEARFSALIRGVFAGNIFDLGAKETIALFANGGVDFDAVRSRLKPRPWRVDGFDALAARFDLAQRDPHRAAVLFVDNAGPDVVLGMLPLARELLNRGTGVILTANALPSLNDVTHDELVGLLEHIAAVDPVVAGALRDGRLEAVASGNDAPLIDLGAVSPALASACERRGADLVVLEGMGRSLESNFEAKLTCDTVKICMVKDLGVASFIGAGLYDLVLRFEPATEQ